MLFLKLATEKALAEARAAREKQYEAMRMAAAPEGAAGSPGKGQPAVHAPCSHPPLLSDSEWLDLSAEEQLAWAKNTQDPRIAVGFQSPLEKKIKAQPDAQASDPEQSFLRGMLVSFREEWSLETMLWCPMCSLLPGIVVSR
ncbi:uncharacterized protein LOC119233651 isoform X2 [Talpa occidentalis]|uniref:uncharacterized protein LOC119233651 isoform X2 n=1 Tax=Talpa occidentalis TaxID=50954 RepID=UPI00188FBA2B|nr:uncharacterized protein LOC119233651 isoform X2 [Talpa occidentalis]